MKYNKTPVTTDATIHVPQTITLMSQPETTDETTTKHSDREIKHCKEITYRLVKHLHVVGTYAYFL